MDVKMAVFFEGHRLQLRNVHIFSPTIEATNHLLRYVGRGYFPKNPDPSRSSKIDGPNGNPHNMIVGLIPFLGLRVCLNRRIHTFEVFKSPFLSGKGSGEPC